MPTIAIYPQQVNDPSFAAAMGFKNYANYLIIGVTDIVSPNGKFYKATLGGGLTAEKAMESYARKWQPRLQAKGWNIVSASNELDALQHIAAPAMGYGNGHMRAMSNVGSNLHPTPLVARGNTWQHPPNYHASPVAKYAFKQHHTDIVHPPLTSPDQPLVQYI